MAEIFMFCLGTGLGFLGAAIFISAPWEEP